MKKNLSFAWFYLQLATVLCFTLAQIAWIKISYSTKLFILGCLFIIGTTIALVSAYPHQTAVSTISPTPPHSDLLVSKTMTRDQLLAQQKHYELLLQQQPNHRDILINAALTAKALGDEQSFTVYWQKAKQIDPNNELFQ